LLDPARAAARRSLGATLSAILPLLLATAAWGQVDCDKYPAGSARRNECYQTEYWQCRRDMESAYRQQEINDALRRRAEQQKERVERGPGGDSGAGWQRDRGGYRFNRGRDDDDER